MEYSQTEAAQYIGIPFRTYQSYEYGQAVPQNKNLAKLERACAPTPYSSNGDGTGHFEERVLNELAELRQIVLGARQLDGH